MGHKAAAVPIEELKETLRLIMLKVGLRANNIPQDEEKMVLINHIVQNYGTHTCEEIKLAFEMAITDRLEIELKDVKTYENFSCLYFSSIMNAYREWARKEIKHAVKPEAPLQIENREDLSNVAMADWLDSVSKDLGAGKLTLELLPVMLYDWLLGKGEVKSHEPYLVPAANRKGAHMENLAIADKNYRPAYNEYTRMFNTGCFSGPYVKELNDLAKKMALNDFILKQKP